MDETFRGFLDHLRQAGELIDFRQPIDIRHIATLVDQSDKALFFHKVIGYDMPVVSGIIRTRERTVMAMGATEFSQIEERLKKGLNNPIPPERVATSPTRERLEDPAHRHVVRSAQHLDRDDAGVGEPWRLYGRRRAAVCTLPRAHRT